MARNSKMVKPEDQRLIRLRVLRTARLSPHWVRVTVGEGEVDAFRPMGYDQWFRLFLPLGGEEGMTRLPAKANTLVGYLKYLRIPAGMRPVMRNYTVRAFRPATTRAGAELDIDFVIHGSERDDTAGPASGWAASAAPGEDIVIIDEGIMFTPERGVDRVVLVGDETALPAISGIAASLPETATGLAIVEVPDAADALEFDRPAGLAVQWVVRGHDAAPGTGALAALREAELPSGGPHAFIAGEQALATGGRRLLVNDRGMDKDAVSFCGYWRMGAASAAARAARTESPA
ncbi:siderophore-interacting protein [Microbacterium sp. SORGH_AS_0888]|uniref:siderophore-interacting protein n=1 Tax=Microbacterium sp. SORGH_AS_0888 TaxID=3041791 RepID=UPI00278A5AD5|nr:siderophore-interacting protein [Microbacterium sp. SORGH_AS_0888]MDQ1130153.1 NADPH-dependent ferric siderophore reductase [Microbacterium sp. SORGH_AS_0888]